MEPLAFVEIVNRHRDVLARHPVYRWPIRVGRGYDADVIVDDPFVAPRHLQIEPAGDGRYAVSDLQSLNGISVSPSERRISAAEVGPDDLVRLGRTQIRIRAPSYPMSEERPLRAAAFYRRPSVFALAAAVVIALILWNLWIMTSDQEEKYTIWLSVLPLLAAVAVWISIWSLVSRTVGGRSNFAAHGFVACAGFAALALSETLFEYLSFGFDLRWIQYLSFAAGAAIFAYMVYRHLRLNSRALRRTLAIAGVVVSIVLYGAAAGLQVATELAQEGLQRYDGSVKAPMFLFVSGASPEAFVSDGESLKRKVDAAARVER